MWWQLLLCEVLLRWAAKKILKLTLLLSILIFFCAFSMYQTGLSVMVTQSLEVKLLTSNSVHIVWQFMVKWSRICLSVICDGVMTVWNNLITWQVLGFADSGLQSGSVGRNNPEQASSSGDDGAGLAKTDKLTRVIAFVLFVFHNNFIEWHSWV